MSPALASVRPARPRDSARVRPASSPAGRRDDRGLLRVDPAARTVVATTVRALARELDPGDLVVVNDAATLPPSLRGRLGRAPIEARLRWRTSRDRDGETWEVAVFGAGDHTIRTEHRERPRLPIGASLRFGGELTATVVSSSASTHEVRFALAGAELNRALHLAGVPVQYAHVPAPLAIWDVQTAYAGRPWAAEMPSAGRALSTEVLLSILERGARIATLTHAAGLSSIGDPAVDAEAPPAERYTLPERTLREIARTRAEGGRIIAVGTTVVRALEGCVAERGQLFAGDGETGWVLGPRSHLAVVDGVLSGLREPGTSHRALLNAFCPEDLLAQAWAKAASLGMRSHELSCCVRDGHSPRDVVRGALG